MGDPRSPRRVRIVPPAARELTRAAAASAPTAAMPSHTQTAATLSLSVAECASANALRSHFFRGTSLESTRVFHGENCYSDARAFTKNAKLATHLATRNFLNRGPERTKAAEVAAGECFRLAGPTGLEPATSGVTGRRSNQLNYAPAS